MTTRPTPSCPRCGSPSEPVPTKTAPRGIVCTACRYFWEQEGAHAAARAAVDCAVQYADEVASAEGWDVGDGQWSDEASDHLYDARETLGAEVYALAKELLEEAERERKERRR